MFNFGRKIRRVARRQYRHGLIESSEYKQIVAGSRNPETVEIWKEAVEQQVPGAPWLTEAQAIDFSSIWEWLKKNWPAILKLLLTLLVFVSEEPKSEDEEEKNYQRGE